MELFKRNQIEEAIARVVENGAQAPSPELRTRIKRLLDTDRKPPVDGLGAGGAIKNSVATAFYSAAAPGKGQEVRFSAYETFALVIGLIFMRHGWPQGFVVHVMRDVRVELERAYAETLKHDRDWLFDREAIRRNAKEGDFAFDNQDPMLLSIVSTSGEEGRNDALVACHVGRPTEAMKFARDRRVPWSVWTSLDVVSMAHRVTRELKETKPQHRGRG